MSTTATLDRIIESPATSGPVRAAFTTPDSTQLSANDAREFDSLEDAALSFSSYGRIHGLNDPDGAVGVVWLGEDRFDSEISLRFDSDGTVFFED